MQTLENNEKNTHQKYPLDGLSPNEHSCDRMGPRRRTWRPTSSTWQERHFLASSPQRTQILTIAHGQDCLCGSPGVQWSFSTLLVQKKKKNLRLDALKKGWEIVLFSSNYSSPKAAQFSAKTDTLGTRFLLQEKWEHMSECSTSPAMWAPAKETYFGFIPSRMLRWASCLWG